MKEFALALSAMTASHHRWPMKPPPEPAAIERPAPVQTRYVDLREAHGRKEAVVTGVLVDQNNISRVDVTLELGNVNQSIQVEAAAPQLQQESTTYDGVVDRKFVEDLPVSFGGTTRDPTASACF